MCDHDMQLTPLEEKLVEIAFADLPRPLRNIELDTILDNNPLFVPGAWSWQACVDDDIRSLWPQLDISHRLIAYIHASARCDNFDDRD